MNVQTIAEDEPSPTAESVSPELPRSTQVVQKALGSSVGHTLQWHQVSLPFGMLQMTMLLDSCARGEEARVEAELERLEEVGGKAVLEAELAATDDWASSTPLHWAAYSGSAPCVQLLIEAGARHDVTNLRDGSTPLHLAARYGQQAAAQALLESDADVNALNNRGNTALHECCSNSEVSGVVETLLRARANLEVYNDPDSGERMMTPLLVAAQAGSLKAVRLLLQRGANPQACVRGASVNPTNRKKGANKRAKLMARNFISMMGKPATTARRMSSCPSLSRSASRGVQPAAPTEESKPEAEAEEKPPPPPLSAVEVEAKQRARLQWKSAAQHATLLSSKSLFDVGGAGLGAAMPWAPDAAPVQDSEEEPQIKLQAVHVALGNGNLQCVAELLEWLWRAKAQVCARPRPVHTRRGMHCPFAPAPRCSWRATSALLILFTVCGLRGEQVGTKKYDVTPIEPVLAFTKLCEVWLNGRQPGMREATRLLGLIVLSCKHVELSAASCAAKLALGKMVPATKELPESTPRNPVMLALKLSVMARLEARRYEAAGRRQRAARLEALRALFECLALALLEGTNFAVRISRPQPWPAVGAASLTLRSCPCPCPQAEQMAQRDSQWEASKVRYQPAAVFSFWLSSATQYATTNSCRLFSASSIVHEHVKNLFLPTATWPSLSEVDASDIWDVERLGTSVLSVTGQILLIILVNLAWLPLLVVAHESRVIARVARQRAAMKAGKSEPWVAWLLPCGRAVLRCASALTLAVILTLRVPSVTKLSTLDFVLAVWAAALIEAIASQVWHQGVRWFISDMFNALDTATLLLLLGMAGCTAYDLNAELTNPSELGVALQSFAVLVAWARLLEISYVFPIAGPQLLTVQYLLADLWHVILSLLFPLLIAFTSSFVIMKQAITSQEFGPAADGYLDVLRLLIGATLNGEPEALQALPLDGVPAPEGRVTIVVSFLLTVAFGFVVVLLLLSMIIARFSLTVSNISNCIDSIYKLKYAQITILYTNRLRSTQLAPQPFNLPRRVALTIYALSDTPAAAHRRALALFKMEHGISMKFPDPHALVRKGSFSSEASHGSRGLSRAYTREVAAGLGNSNDPNSMRRDSFSSDGRGSPATVGRESPSLAAAASSNSVSTDDDTNELDMVLEVERFVQRATAHARIFPEMLVETCAALEHRIVDEAGRTQMEVTIDKFAEQARKRTEYEEEVRRRELRLAKQVDGLRAHINHIQGQLEEAAKSAAPGRKAPGPGALARSTTMSKFGVASLG